MSEATENKQYSHQEVEAKWTKQWLQDEIFKVQINDSKEKFSIALPPPNVTGELHMGHALGGTIQDILIRYNRMLGKDVLWQIGTDHAGIGTQIVVEKNLRKTENKRKEDLGREKFIEKVKAWKEEYGNKIIEQMKLLGFSPDYSRIRYTMDDHYADAVKKAFIKYFNDGIIYRGNRITNWCPHCLTSLSDLEIAKEQAKKKLYQIAYKIKGSNEAIIVATTRPETMFGDVAVAINPNDERFTSLIQAIKKSPGSIKVLIPFTNKEIPVILDDHVKTDFGTGALKVTPAHDANDNEIALRHGLPQVIIMDKQAKMSACAEVPEWLHNLERFKARDLVVEKLTELEQLGEISEYQQEKDLHDRCNTEIEPYLSDQWYVSMKQLAKLALEAESSGRSKFIPERYSSIFKVWLENIQDWCISRQIWWGHRIPVYYYDATPKNTSLEELILITKKEKNCFIKDGKLIRYYAAISENDFVSDSRHASGEEAELTKPSMSIPRCERNEEDEQKHLRWQDEDVLDTWFSSALWPFETLKDDPKIYQKFYPTDVLATAREIINLWVSRMIYSSEYFEGKEPFKDILIHPVVQTPDGKRMSKSKGNAIDPLDMVSKYGADASRMWYASVGVYGQQDVRFPGRKDPKEGWLSDQFEQYRKFVNKLFNATKYVMLQLGEDFKPVPIESLNKSSFTIADTWILNKFTEMLSTVSNAYKDYDLGTVQKSIYEFLWFDFCDWYIELTKAMFQNKGHQWNFAVTSDSNGQELPVQKQILFYVIESSLRILHPIMPFITEQIWQDLRSKYDFSAIDKTIIDNELEPQYKASISFAKYPRIPEGLDMNNQSEQMDFIIKIISGLRNLRQSLDIAWSKPISVFIKTSSPLEREFIENKNSYFFISKIAKVENLKFQGEAEKPVNISIIGETQIIVPLAGLVDLDKLKTNINKKIDKLNQDAKVIEQRLGSENFVKNAAPEKVEETRRMLEDLLGQKEFYQSELMALS